MDKEPTFENRVVGVFRDRGLAERAAQAAKDAAGLQPTQVRIEDPVDRRFVLRGEMREEADHTIVGPGPLGPYTKETTKGLMRGFLLFIPLGAVVALPLGFIHAFGLSFGIRLLVAALIGAVAGATVALSVAGASARGSDPGDMAAERGLTVGVVADDPEQARRAAEAMAALDPIRLDTGISDRPTGLVTREPEDEKSGRGTLRD